MSKQTNQSHTKNNLRETAATTKPTPYLQSYRSDRNKPITSTQKPNTTETITLLDSSNELTEDTFRDVDIDLHLDKIDAANNQPTTIKQLLENTKTNTIYEIRAKFRAVVEKLTVLNEAWYLKIEIEDASGAMTAEVNGDLLRELIGFDPSAVARFKEDRSEEMKMFNVGAVCASDGFGSNCLFCRPLLNSGRSCCSWIAL